MNTAAPEITVQVNGAPRTFATAVSILDALREMGLAERKGIAIAVNDGVVPRSQWPTHTLSNGEHLLVIQATQGG